jgi:hypothetical protein
MKTLRLLLLVSASLLPGAVGQAQVLMLDFGPTTVTGASQANSPYHTVVPSFTGTVWNRIQTADVLSGLLYADGTEAAGLTLDLGATTTETSTIVGLGNTPSGNNALGNVTNTDVYAGTSVGKDGIYTGSGGGSLRFVGFQLGGLAPGTYEIYLTSRNTNTSNAYSQIAYVGTSATAGDFDAVTLSLTGSLSYANGSDAVLSWEVNENYLKFTVTLNPGDYLNLAVSGGASGERRGFLNSVQIVAVPEPSGILLLGLAGVWLTVFRRNVTGRSWQSF